MKDKDVKDRIYNFYTNPEIINTLTSLSGWGNVGVWVGQGGREQALMDKDRYNELDNLGDNILSQGTNNNLEYPESEPERLKIHDDLHAELFQKLTKLELETLHFPKVCGFRGINQGENFIIPHSAYRFGYYMSHIKKFCDKKPEQKHTIVEIGGGWGGLCNLVLNNVPNANYVIVDINSTIPAAAYMLHKCGKTICLPNEHADSKEKLISDYDCVFMLPEQLDQLDSCDYVVSNCALPELHKDVIDFYMNQIKRLLPKKVYSDNTRHGNGLYVIDSLRKTLQNANYKNTLSQVTPINCYIPYITRNCENEIVEENIYELV